VRSLRVAWTRDGKGFFYGRYPEPRSGRALEAALRDKKIYYHALGTPQSADLLIYERPEEPMLFIDVDIDETGRYVSFQTQRGISKNELIVKDLVTPPRAQARCSSAGALFGPHRFVCGPRRRQRDAVRVDRS
jgi:prolyl oligopeptidase